MEETRCNLPRCRRWRRYFVECTLRREIMSAGRSICRYGRLRRKSGHIHRSIRRTFRGGERSIPRRAVPAICPIRNRMGRYSFRYRRKKTLGRRRRTYLTTRRTRTRCILTRYRLDTCMGDKLARLVDGYWYTLSNMVIAPRWDRSIVA